MFFIYLKAILVSCINNRLSLVCTFILAAHFKTKPPANVQAADKKRVIII